LLRNKVIIFLSNNLLYTHWRLEPPHRGVCRSLGQLCKLMCCMITLSSYMDDGKFVLYSRVGFYPGLYCTDQCIIATLLTVVLETWNQPLTMLSERCIICRRVIMNIIQRRSKNCFSHSRQYQCDSTPLQIDRNTLNTCVLVFLYPSSSGTRITFFSFKVLLVHRHQLTIISP
jgi:hypothetical protein